MIKDQKSSQDLARKTEVHRKLKRMGRGARKVKPGGGKGPVLVLMLLLLCMGWLCYGLVDGLMMGGLLGRLYCIATGLVTAALAVGLTMTLLWVWGGPLQARRVEEALARIGFTNANGEVPELLSITRHSDNPKIKVYEFEICGIPVPGWLDFAEKIQSALNVTIIDVQYMIDCQHIRLTVAPPAVTLPTKIPWHDRLLPLDPYVVSLGQSLAGDVLLDLKQIPHVLVGGITGSGKTVLLKSILFQLICWGADLYIVDLKGIDFGRWWEARCHLCTDESGVLPILDKFMDALAERKNLLHRANCRNIDEYNARRAHKLRCMIFACDEAAELLDKTGADKDGKAFIAQVESRLSTLARLGRAMGLHLVLGMQRADTETLKGQIRSNMGCRICGKADPILEKITIGTSGAVSDLIPNGVQGRFILNEGDGSTNTVFQGYLFREREDADDV